MPRKTHKELRDEYTPYTAEQEMENAREIAKLRKRYMGVGDRNPHRRGGNPVRNVEDQK